MLQNAINKLKGYFTVSDEHTKLEAFIVAGNPQSTYDVDRLEKQFYAQQSQSAGVYNHFTTGGTHR